MASYDAIEIPVPVQVAETGAIRGMAPTTTAVQSPNYAATVNPAFGQNITELDG